MFLDSALRVPELGRYSFLAADPIQWLQVPADGSNGLGRLSQLLDELRAELPADPLGTALPSALDASRDLLAAAVPFRGGVAGLFSYDLARSLERVPRPRFEEFDVPALAIGCYDVVLAFDHAHERAWLFSNGWPATDLAARHSRARQRLDEFTQLLAGPPVDMQVAPANSREGTLARDELAPQYSVGSIEGLMSNFDAAAYRDTIARAVDYIRAGDVFQVNLAQRLIFPQQDSSPAFYLRLRGRNPAPFAGYFDLGPYQLLSASPERFVRLSGRLVEARPIKGTRRRTSLPEADLFAGDDLRASEKDRAENVMIVDLLRNDLSRVCRADSVQVTQLCGLETYQFVQHLVSVVRGELATGHSAIDLIRAAFPGGSITGAPKFRAMEIIAELEPTARGPYCGSLGYLSWDGQLDLSILIRTVVAGRGWWQFPVGGGITAQSDPQLEYEETWHKAHGLVESLR